jgi:hypothetical protein
LLYVVCADDRRIPMHPCERLNVENIEPNDPTDGDKVKETSPPK